MWIETQDTVILIQFLLLEPSNTSEMCCSTSLPWSVSTVIGIQVIYKKFFVSFPTFKKQFLTIHQHLPHLHKTDSKYHLHIHHLFPQNCLQSHLHHGAVYISFITCKLYKGTDSMSDINQMFPYSPTLYTVNLIGICNNKQWIIHIYLQNKTVH